MNKLIVIPISAIFFFLIDYYVFQAIKSITNSRTVYYIYWGITALSIVGFLLYHFLPPDVLGKQVRLIIMTGLFINYISKFVAILFLFIADIIRFFQWIWLKISQLASNKTETPAVENTITRSQFLTKTAMVASTIPAISLTWGILSGAHDYRIRHVKLKLKNLPKGFEGMKIGQLSDIHSGSFFNKTAVKGGVEMLMREKPDAIFFTGDLVNNVATEVNDFINIFDKIKAPLGVFSTLGNHDYGDYVQWDSKDAKRKNLQDLMAAHKQLGWDLLMDENRFLTQSNEKISIIGIQNWGAGARWPKYGNLEKAKIGTEEIATKLLLSHDPSHWNAQVLPKHKDIDVMFSGHTHGMQFGIENELFKWSPSQYVYKQWAGLYQENDQQIYVNRGFGYLGYPGRVGILPEITIFELQRG
jgi:uncharacterized protein